MKFKSIISAVLICALYGCASVQHSSSNKELNVEEVKAAMIKAVEWQEAHPIFAAAPTDWTVGAYYTGVARAHKTTRDAIYLTALKNHGYWNKWETYTRLHHADDVAISYSYLYQALNEKRRKLVDLKPTHDFLQAHLYENDPWKEGTLKNKFGKNILWWWCDALFMAPPVITLYAKYTKDEKYLDDMHKFYMQTYNRLYDKEENLFARDLRYVWKGTKKDLKEENGKKIFWSRGNGWVIGGLALILDDMPKDYKHRAFYEKLFKEMSARMLSLQSKDGLWTTSLLSPESFNHGEVSGSGFHTFALAWGVNNGYLDAATYTPAVKKAWKALQACQHADGRVGWVQDIGASPEPASKNSWQNFGTGAFLLAGSEVLKLK
ncbi:glycoside hydrolase family 88/105 protein [Wenyingzhuangia sp. IMCC45574]